MKAMEKQEQQEEVAVKERDDGTALAAIEDKPDPFEGEGEESEEVKAEEPADPPEAEENEGEDREALREARREERKLKKELAKQREVSAKHKISALERRNEEMARRLAQLENATTGFQFAQLDKFIEDEATRVEYAKMKMTQAAKAGDAVSQAEFMEQFHESKINWRRHRCTASNNWKRLKGLETMCPRRCLRRLKRTRAIGLPATRGMTLTAKTWIARSLRWSIMHWQARDGTQRTQSIGKN